MLMSGAALAPVSGPVGRLPRALKGNSAHPLEAEPGLVPSFCTPVGKSTKHRTSRLHASAGGEEVTTR